MILAETRAAYQTEILRAAADLASKPMRYGVDDCLLFVANIDVAVTGVDPAADVRGRYDSKFGALRLLGEGGVAAKAEAVAMAQGWTPINPMDARPGDRGLVTTPEGPAGVIFSGEFWFGRADTGITAFRTAFAGRPIIDRAWAL